MKIIAFYCILLFLLFSTTYLGLVATDYLIFSYTRSLSKEAVNDTRNIIKIRNKIDREQRELAIERGYLPVFFPDSVRANNYFRKLAEKLDVAPLGGQPYEEVYFCNEGYGLQTFKTDRFGFRNKDELYENDIDTLIIGDSFGAGACVENKHTIQSILTEKFARPTVSLSTGGASPIHYAAVGKTFISKIKPKNVILLFYTNDRVFGDDLSYFNSYYFGGKKRINYFSNSSEDISSLKLSNNLLFFYKEVNEYLLQINNKNLSNIAHNDAYEVGNFYDRAKKFLSLSHIFHILRLNTSSAPYSTHLAIDVSLDNCEDIGCNVSVWFIPSSQKWDATPFSDLYIKELSKASKEKAKFTNLSKDINKYGEAAYAISGGHLSPLGYMAVAQKIHVSLPSL